MSAKEILKSAAPSQDQIEKEGQDQAVQEQQIREQVDIRNKEEQAKLEELDPEATRKKGPDRKIDSKFILECLNRNELGDADLYKALHRGTFVFDNSRDAWLVDMGSHYGIDKLKNAMIAVDDVAKLYLEEAKRIAQKIRETSANGDDPGHLESIHKKLHKRIENLRGVRRRKNCLELARTSKNPMAIVGNEIDKKPFLVPCENGVINLKTGELETPRQENLLEKFAPVSMPEKGIEADCPLWKKTLLEIFSGNTELVDYLRRLLGYCLIGSVTLALFVVLVGRGRNGKSLIVSVLQKIMGPLAGTIRSEMLLDQGGVRNSAAPTPDIMTLRGLRLGFASETDDGCKLSPSRVKWLSGNDTLTGRLPHDKYEVQFPPSHTLFLLTNHKPHAPADDFAFWERMAVIQFNLSFVDRPPKADFERRADPNLAEKLEKEFPAILAWMVRGCLEFQQIGLDPPPAVKQAVADYQRDEDLLGDFLESCCVIGPNYSIEFSQIFPAFVEWWDGNVGTRTPSKIWLAKVLKQKGFEKTRGRTSRYYGLALLADDGMFRD